MSSPSSRSSSPSGGSAGANPVAFVAKALSGSSIKKRSIPGLCPRSRTPTRCSRRARGRAAWGERPLWIDGGNADPFRAADEAFARALHVRHRVWPVGHNSDYWQAHYGAYLRFYARALARC